MRKIYLTSIALIASIATAQPYYTVNASNYWQNDKEYTHTFAPQLFADDMYYVSNKRLQQWWRDSITNKQALPSLLGNGIEAVGFTWEGEDGRIHLSVQYMSAIKDDKYAYKLPDNYIDIIAFFSGRYSKVMASNSFNGWSHTYKLAYPSVMTQEDVNIARSNGASLWTYYWKQSIPKAPNVDHKKTAPAKAQAPRDPKPTRDGNITITTYNQTY